MDTDVVVQVGQLLARYGHVLDAADWDALDQLFLPDATIDYRGMATPTVCTGIEEIRGYFERAGHPSAHHMSNVYVWDDSGVVRAKSKFFAPFTRSSHEPHRWFGGDYDDVLERTDAGWRFRHRRCQGRWQYATGEASADPRRRTW